MSGWREPCWYLGRLSCSSSVKERAEALMQQVVETEFQDKTVISVIHRYLHIDWFDRVAVLRGGRLVQCDRPPTLLQREGSALREP